MGQTGTDVTKKHVHDSTDDNFATIVARSRRKGASMTILESLSVISFCNLGKCLLCFLVLLVGLPLPLLPIQILWSHLVADGLPAMALG